MKGYLLALSCMLPSCASVEFVLAPRGHSSNVERSPRANNPEPDGTSEGFAPRAEAWTGAFGFAADYREWQGDSGLLQVGNGRTQYRSKESQLRFAMLHRIGLGDGDLDVGFGVRRLRFEANVFDQRSARPTPSRYSFSEKSEGVFISARYSYPLGPAWVRVFADVDAESGGGTHSIGASALLPVSENIAAVFGFERLQVDTGDPFASLDGSVSTVFAGLEITF